MSYQDHIPSFWRGVRTGIRYTASDVSRVTGIPQETIVAHIQRGWLRANRSHQGWWIIRLRSIRNWLRRPEVARLLARIMVQRAENPTAVKWVKDVDPMSEDVD